ncbi:MAG: 3-deoxy-D-manno-octulosonic acid transferase [Desulfobacteraceae bacterium]|nr:3-deoxy-D-manno-octulosonic acid transferase [Desulfobacteraceae bacterium]
MSEKLTHKTAFLLYDLIWGAIIPILRRNQRLAEGFAQRIFQQKPGKADLWIHAASAGEAYLASGILENLNPSEPTRVLITSNTKQGIEILDRAIGDIIPNTGNITACAAYSPFDKPSVIKKAARDIQPRVMVLLESEIWPGVLRTLKKNKCRVFIINGRITDRSLKRYLVWPSLWYSLRPDRILAVSGPDAKRFATLFRTENAGVMPNIKFDMVAENRSSEKNPLENILGHDKSLLVIGSVNQEEEPLVEKIILRIRQNMPGTVTGLFPRHMHRLKHWQERLDSMEVPWILRTEIEKTVSGTMNLHGKIILWDTFGELRMAYELSKAAFVGGSLAPLGGQNFLEPLTCGIIPVIGHYWDTFHWVGREIVDQGLVRVADTWREAADILLENMEQPLSREKVREASVKYMKDRQGGAAQACRLIEKYLG